ncbi:zona pellucida sperm-binding protein 3-like [Sinocyclocheilus grahami]|uniref:zona pellucida sperm-binding protein 3-like n=1 Tax=Sinocyclocheilus grahami TaxID=75366 RepID=UPI0007ACB0DE|nr:PREDICTED: zona pellucida sperm-binding protein 3-like [Sinocyclocheilus grahami]
MVILQGVLVLIVAFDLKNAWGSLIHSQSPHSMKPQSDPASRGPGFSSQAFLNPLQKASQFQSLDSRGFVQEPLGFQEKQLLQGPIKPLDWRFPIVPEVQSELVVDFQLRQPVTPSSVAVQYVENRILVEVKKDLFSNGQLIQPSRLSMGGCPVFGEDSASRVLLFEYELQDCNSVLMMTEDALVYTFTLTYTPEAFAGTQISQHYGVLSLIRCLVDATASSSRFMPRTQEDQIRFQLEAFMFQGGHSPSIYITCIVKATLASAPSDALRKSCSFSNGWLAADGNHQACGCCDSTCGPDGGNAAPFGGIQWEGKASLGPVMVQERLKTFDGFQ